MGASSFADEIIKNSPIGHGLTKMATRDKEVLENRFEILELDKLNSLASKALKEQIQKDFYHLQKNLSNELEF